MEIRQLKNFLAVAEARNFRRAAERVHLSQQAVSKSIMQLERELSVTLFERGRQSVLLTEEGRLLLPFARDIIADLRRFDDAVSDSTGRQFGQLRIGATPNLLDDVVPATLRQFHDRFTQARLVVERGDFPLLRDMMLQGELDLILSSAPDQLPRHLVSTTVIGRDHNVVVVRAGHPLAGGGPVTAAQLAAYPMLAIHNYPRGEAYLERLFAGSPMPRPALKAGSTDFALSWVRGSDFWWIVPQCQVHRAAFDSGLVILPVEPRDESWNLVLATRRNAARSPLVEAYVEMVIAYTARLRDTAAPHP